ncbi:FAD/NAD(P)-binding protein [Ancylobacter terrae]|uniref:FAD/NAD(P)-binding protein n=1 Tax=Ancylobacter sp. sgz301288 TaxID=3342077 RepID=UPI00385D74FC
MSRSTAASATCTVAPAEEGLRRRIGIIGGGFTGAMFAVHLARSARTPVDIDILEPRPTLGAGLAYGSCRPEHRINVPSDRLSVFAEEPLHFSDWLRRTGRWQADADALTAEGDHYSRRFDFGSYIAELVAETAASNASVSTIRHVRAAASGLERHDGAWRVDGDDGSAATYDDVVLCATYGAPAFPWPLREDAAAQPHLVRNPWDWPAITAIPRDADVFVIGTGLTMCDAIVTLRQGGHRGSITAVSRRALTPRPHGEFDTEYDLFAGAPPPATALGLLRQIRRHIRDLAAEGRQWHAVVDSLRRSLFRYWASLPIGERATIVRRLRAYWDVHRFRIAPQVAQLMADGQREGWLAVRAGRIAAIGVEDGRFAVRWTPKGEAARTGRFGAIINCTGPDADLARSANPLLSAAIRDGHVRPDALRLGLDVDALGHVLGRDGTPTPGLWAAGPLARAVVGEATGVPEASAHARLVARALTETANERSEP